MAHEKQQTDPQELVDPQELAVGQHAARVFVDATPYGSTVPDSVCRDIAGAVVSAVEEYRSRKAVHDSNRPAGGGG